MISRGDRLNLVLKVKVGSATTKAVLFVLADYIGSGRTCWPSHETIAENACCSRRSVVRATLELEEAGILLVHRRVDDIRGNTSNLYEINYPLLAKLAAECQPVTGGVCQGDTTPVPQSHKGVCHGVTQSAHSDPPIDPPIKNPPTPQGGGRASGKPKGEPAGFADWYAAYPRHEARADAAKAYRQVTAAGADPGVLLDAASAFAASPAGQAGKFCPLPASWLRAGRWDDDRASWQRNGQAVNLNGAAPPGSLRAQQDEGIRRVLEEEP